MSFNIEQRIEEIRRLEQENRDKIYELENPSIFSSRHVPYPGSKEYEPIFRLNRENQELFAERIRLENELRRREGLPPRLPYQPEGESELQYMDRVVREHEEDKVLRSRNKLQRDVDKKNAELIEEFGDSPEVQIYVLEQQLRLHDRSSPEYREIKSLIRDLKQGVRQAKAYEMFERRREEDRLASRDDSLTESDEERLLRQDAERYEAEEAIPRSSAVRKFSPAIQTRVMPVRSRSSSPVRRATSPVRRMSSPSRRVTPSSKITTSRVETVERRSRSRSCKRRASRRRSRRRMPPRDPKTGRFLPRCR